MTFSVNVKKVRYLWLSLLLFIFCYYLYHPNFFEKENIAALLSGFEHYGMLLLLVLQMLRSFTFLPPTWLIFAGLLLFPNELFELFIVSVLGSVIAGTLAYGFAKKMNFEEWLMKNEKLYHTITTGLHSKFSFLIIVGWILFPFVPSDVISYAAGASKVRFVPFFIALLIGKISICCFYIYGGNFILENILAI